MWRSPLGSCVALCAVPTNSRPRCNFVDRNFAGRMLDLAGYDAHYGPLALSVLEAHFRWHAARAAQHTAPISGGLAIGRALRFARRKPSLKWAGQPAHVLRASRLHSWPSRTPAFAMQSAR